MSRSSSPHGETMHQRCCILSDCHLHCLCVSMLTGLSCCQLSPAKSVVLILLYSCATAAVLVCGHRDKVLLDHVFSSTAILSYILSWMVFYNLAHVFT